MVVSRKEVTRGITFRVPDSVLHTLEGYSRRKQVSLNTLANQIFRSYVEWDSAAVEAGWMVFPKPALKELIDRTAERDLEAIAKRKAEYHRDIMLLMLGSNDLDGFLSILRQSCARSGFPYTEAKKADGQVNFIVQHDMGEKWSFFTRVLYMMMVNDLGYRADIETTKNTLVIKISNGRT